MQDEHTPAWVAGSRVAGFRVIGFEPADAPDRLRAVLDAVERHGHGDDGVKVGAAFALVDPPAAAGVSGDGGGGVGGQLAVVGDRQTLLDDRLVKPNWRLDPRTSPGKVVDGRRLFAGSAP
jgi:hypothetical protein